MPSIRKPMNALERRAVSGLAGIFAMRMLGLFLIMPVFALYAENLRGHTPFLIGLALGAYGLTQAVLQIPLGMLSDRIGRKRVIAGGLLMFAAGSVVAASADTITGVIIGRALQGAGAIAAAVMALAADLTRDEQRTKAMAIIGVTIGASFIISMILGSVLHELLGVRGMFWMTAVLAVVGMLLLWRWVPTPRASIRGTTAQAGQFGQVLRDTYLLRLDIGIFILHCVMTALFVVVPTALVQQVGLHVDDHWHVYVPVMLLSALTMVPLIYVAERKHRMRQMFSAAVLLLAVALAVMYEGFHTLGGLAVGLFVFFTGFNFLEAALPSLISRAAPPTAKGTAIGVYTTFEFLGAFVGGAAGGWLHGSMGLHAVLLACAGLVMAWLLIALTLTPPQLSTRTVTVSDPTPDRLHALAAELGAIQGVAEAVALADEGVIRLKVDDRVLDPSDLDGWHAVPGTGRG